MFPESLRTENVGTPSEERKRTPTTSLMSSVCSFYSYSYTSFMRTNKLINNYCSIIG